LTLHLNVIFYYLECEDCSFCNRWLW